MSGFSRISSVAVHLPQQRQTAAEMEATMRATQPHLLILDGLLERLYGLQERRVAPPGSMPSDLAAAAGEVALQRAGLAPSDVDLLIFASVREDLEEPATAHVVAHKAPLNFMTRGRRGTAVRLGRPPSTPQVIFLYFGTSASLSRPVGASRAAQCDKRCGVKGIPACRGWIAFPCDPPE